METLRKEKKDSLANLLNKLKSSGFTVSQCEEVYKNVIVVENTWKVIFNNRDIRRLEFGQQAYSGIPFMERPQFVAEYARQFELKRIDTNSHFCMILAEKL